MFGVVSRLMTGLGRCTYSLDGCPNHGISGGDSAVLRSPTLFLTARDGREPIKLAPITP